PLLLLSYCVASRDLPSFPTRRSSDLTEAGRSRLGGGRVSRYRCSWSSFPAKGRCNDERRHRCPAPRIPTHPTRSDSAPQPGQERSEEHTSELQSRFDLVCRLLLEKKK